MQKDFVYVLVMLSRIIFTSFHKKIISLFTQNHIWIAYFHTYVFYIFIQKLNSLTRQLLFHTDSNILNKIIECFYGQGYIWGQVLWETEKEKDIIVTKLFILYPMIILVFYSPKLYICYFIY